MYPLGAQLFIIYTGDVANRYKKHNVKYNEIKQMQIRPKSNIEYGSSGRFFNLRNKHGDEIKQIRTDKTSNISYKCNGDDVLFSEYTSIAINSNIEIGKLTVYDNVAKIILNIPDP